MSTRIENQSIYHFRDREFVKVPSKLAFSDRLGSWKARWGINRMNYKVEPGLYAVGDPDASSPVMVSANYKMSFDFLRSNLGGIDAWILVLDTKGINVWCAAGKGTFGTTELIARMVAVKLNEVVDHKKLIVPQLGAVGVSAHLVKALSGFQVNYGPVRASDIPAFMKNGMNTTKEMRQVTFPFTDRIVLVPMELVGGLPSLVIAMVIFFLLSAINETGYSWPEHLALGLESIRYILIAYIVGCVLGPILLPYIPATAFSTKGFLLGLVFAIWIVLAARFSPVGADSGFTMYSWLLLVPTITSFILMNFTGASTYTSLSGVVKEMKYALPAQAIGLILGLALWITGRFV